jgi:hypothetical protein
LLVFDDFGLLSTLAAMPATRFDVCSFFDIWNHLLSKGCLPDFHGAGKGWIFKEGVPMSSFDRLEIIAEIEVAAEALGMDKLTVLGRLPDLPDNDLFKLWSALKAIGEVQS